MLLKALESLRIAVQDRHAVLSCVMTDFINILNEYELPLKCEHNTVNNGFYHYMLDRLLEHVKMKETKREVVLFRVVEAGFIFGFVLLNKNHTLNFFFFEESSVGLAAITKAHGTTDFYKLSVQGLMLPDDEIFSASVNLSMLH